MAVKIEILDLVPEDKLVETIELFGASHADIVTAINDDKGTFTIEATFFGGSPAGSAITFQGKMSTFGGPNDDGVRSDEGLSLYGPGDVAANPDLFLPKQPPGTTGLARRLNPKAKYLACRWNLSITPKSFLRLNTTKVTVSNPRNGRSAQARPADTGPAVFTQRVADLSPGLADALGLKTNDICQVEIPTPAGTPFAAGTGVAMGVDPAEIDKIVFPKDMALSLVVVTTSNQTTLWVTKAVGQNEGGQTLTRKVGGSPPEILRTDTVVLPIQADAQISESVAAELNKAIHKEPDTIAGPAGPAPQPGDDIDSKVFVSAKAFLGFVTRNVPGTEQGSLACAWAVNEVVRRALGKPISTDNGGNGLGTDGIFDVLQKNHTPIDMPKRGAIVISPTVPGKHGHVGIVGQDPGDDGSTQIFSNSSSRGVFAQNYTIQTWTQHFTHRGLEVLFFELKGDQFV